MTEPERHDWQQIITELETAGVTRYKLSVICEADKNTVKAWAEGKSEPRHHAGELLLACHADVVSRETEGEIHLGEKSTITTGK